MVSKILSRLTYANVMATLALFVALGGTSYAAVTIGSAAIKDNSIQSVDVHDGTLRGADIANGTIASADILDGTITAADIKAGVLAPKLFGNFNGDDGSLVRGQGVLSSTRTGTGLYWVQFARDLSDCVILSSVASIDAVNPEIVTIGTGVAGDSVFVLIRKDFADTREDADFSLAVLCP